MHMQIISVDAVSPDLEAIHQLFLEYAKSLGFSLCFQGFDKELAGLPGDYAPPRGCLLLAKEGERVAGCVGVRAIDKETCEMKRLYVRPEFCGTGMGRRLAETAIARARAAGYRRMCLDTLPVMKDARDLYASLGFTRCAPYYDNTCAGSDCFELSLERR